MRKSSQALSPYYQRTAFLRDADFMELAESLVGGIEACVSFQLPLNSSLLNQWTDLPLQLSGLYTPSLQSYPIASGYDCASGIDVANNTGVLSTSVSPAKIAIDKPMHELEAEEKRIPIPKPLQTNEFFSASIHNSPFKESIIAQRPHSFMKPYVSVEEVEEPTNVDVGVDCFDEIENDDNIENDVQLSALLCRVDAMTKKDTPSIPIPSTSAEALKGDEAEIKESNRLEDDTANLNKEPIVIETETTAMTVSNTSPAMGNSIISKMGWSSTEENDENVQRPTLEPSVSVSSIVSRPLSRSNSLNNSTTNQPIDRFSYNSLVRRGEKRARDGDSFYTRQIDFNDVWQRFESTLGIFRSADDTSNESQQNVASKNAQRTEECDEDGLVDFEFVQADSLSMKFSLDELREMVQQTFKIPHELGLDSQNFACLSCGNPLGVGGSGYTTTQ